MSSLWTPGGERPVDRRPAGPAPRTREVPPDDPDALSPEEQQALEEHMAAMQAELAATPASVVIANHVVGIFQLAAIHLNQRPPNLEDGRLAIDAMAAIVEGLGDRLGEEAAALRDALTQLRLAFVQLRDGAGSE